MQRALFWILTVTACMAYGQSKQSIKGTISDRDSGIPLIGASVIVKGSEPVIGAVTDMEGNFELKGIAVGRHDVEVSYIGYKTIIVPNIIVTAGKQSILAILLEEEFLEIDEVVIKAKRNSHTTATISINQVDQKFIGSVAGSRNDPANSVKNLAGVGAANDTRNDIIIRGNSPTGLLWKMEGIPIPSPNHFSTMGTTGGPVGALNTNLLSTSDFMTSAFPAEYGNASSGVFDVKLRSGNKDKFEHTLQLAAFSGLEFMTEGPLNKKHNASYLISYRFSITGIIPEIIDISPVYQDLNFKFDLPNSKAGKFTIFGLFGTSSINFLREDVDGNDVFADPNQDAYVKSRVGILGINHNKLVSENAYIKTSVAATTSQSFYDQDDYFGDTAKLDVVHAKDITNRIILSSLYNNKISSRATFRIGATSQLFDVTTQFRDRKGYEEFTFKRDFNGFIGLIEAFFHSRFRISPRLTMNSGIHHQFMTLSGSWSIEPRLGLKLALNENHVMTFGYGMHSQMQPFPIYFYQETLDNGSIDRSNRSLDFTRSEHVVLGYEYLFSGDWRIKTELYFQYLHNVGVEKDSSTSFSVLNAGADFVFPEKSNLSNDGSGFNYGAELTLEKFFSKGYYCLLTGSLFTSKYKGSDNILRHTAFDNTYIVNFLAGKEFEVGKEKRQAILMDLKITSAGGRYYTPVDLEASRAAGEEVLIEESANSMRYEPYFKMDFKVGIRMNSKKRNYSQQLFVDLQNITNRKNIYVKQYNELTNEVNQINQDGFFADILFRIQF